jgi:hypothetical protein
MSLSCCVNAKGRFGVLNFPHFSIAGSGLKGAL